MCKRTVFSQVDSEQYKQESSTEGMPSSVEQGNTEHGAERANDAVIAGESSSSHPALGNTAEPVREDWVEVQRKRKALRNETKVGEDYSVCGYLLTQKFVQTGATPPQGGPPNENEELDFEFDDDLQLGGKVHNFSDQPWYGFLPLLCACVC